LAKRLPADAVRVGTRVTRAEPGSVTLASGERLTARAVIVATEQPEAQRLVGRPMRAVGRSVTCHYFAAPKDPLRGEPVLVLDGERTGPVNNLCVPSNVSPALAPAGQALVSATVIGLPDEPDAALESAVRAQMTSWFGAEVAAWRRLRTYRIPYALPAPAIATPRGPEQVAQGLWLAGDHRETASLQGAITSGAQAAQQVARAAGVPV
jgi:protoporphyrinogen oxidase